MSPMTIARQLAAVLATRAAAAGADADRTAGILADCIEDVIESLAAPAADLHFDGAARLVALEVARHFGVTPRALASTSRPAAIARPRHVLAWLLRAEGLSFPAVGAALGGRHHTTIMSSVRAVEADPELRAAATAILERLAAGSAA